MRFFSAAVSARCDAVVFIVSAFPFLLPEILFSFALWKI
jgi:hypothetical protein